MLTYPSMFATNVCDQLVPRLGFQAAKSALESSHQSAAGFRQIDSQMSRHVDFKLALRLQRDVATDFTFQQISRVILSITSGCETFTVFFFLYPSSF